MPEWVIFLEELRQGVSLLRETLLDGFNEGHHILVRRGRHSQLIPCDRLGSCQRVDQRLLDACLHSVGLFAAVLDRDACHHVGWDGWPVLCLVADIGVVIVWQGHSIGRLGPCGVAGECVWRPVFDAWDVHHAEPVT